MLVIKTGDICWINQPYEYGLYNVIIIFRDTVMLKLGEGKRVESDDGYIGKDPKHMKFPKRSTKDGEREGMKARVRSRKETVNNRFKCRDILKEMYRHDMSKHGNVFRAIIVITQLAINRGENVLIVDIMRHRTLEKFLKKKNKFCSDK